jgi:hypothetical protein
MPIAPSMATNSQADNVGRDTFRVDEAAVAESVMSKINESPAAQTYVESWTYKICNTKPATLNWA